MTIGQRIRNTRIEQNISQESLAELADVSLYRGQLDG